MTTQRRIHPAVLDAASDLRKGKMNRREFLRFATLLGATATTAYALAGCAAPSDATSPASGWAGSAFSSGGAGEAAVRVEREGRTSALARARFRSPPAARWEPRPPAQARRC